MSLFHLRHVYSQKLFRCCSAILWLANVNPKEILLVLIVRSMLQAQVIKIF